MSKNKYPKFDELYDRFYEKYFFKDVFCRFCRKCRCHIDNKDYYLNNSKKTGKQTYCKDCKKRADKVYYEKNKEKILTQKREKQREYAKVYYQRKKNQALNGSK